PARGLRRHADVREGMIGRQAPAQVNQEVLYLAREILDPDRAGAGLECTSGDLVAAGGTADAEVYATGIERLQHPELLRHLEWTVMSQHHSTRADAHRGGAGRDPRHHDLRRRAREPFGRVMLGEPIP